MEITNKINKALNRIVEEDHIIQKGIREALFDAVAPLYDTETTFFPLRPSSCLKPLRDLFYDLKNFYIPGSIPKSPLDPRIKLVFQFGHMTEILLKKLFAYSYGVQAEQERVKYGELIDASGNTIELTGSIDWASTVGGPTLVLCDAKSIGDFPFKKAPKAENVAQMQLYMHSDWGRANKVDRALLIYFNKNTSDIKCIEVGYEAELAQMLLDRLKLAFEYYKKDELPPREYLAGLDWQASYSAYADYDNAEFTLSVRPTITLDTEFIEGNQALREHVEKYGNKLVIYLDKEVQVNYINNKLILDVKER